MTTMSIADARTALTAQAARLRPSGNGGTDYLALVTNTTTGESFVKRVSILDGYSTLADVPRIVAFSSGLTPEQVAVVLTVEIPARG